MPEFRYYPLKLVYPSFDSDLTDLIIELEHLRKKEIRLTTHRELFSQLNHVFHTLESIASARIEGNNTTIAEYIETKIEEGYKKPPNVKEILNLEKTMSYIEDVIDQIQIDGKFLAGIHKRIVDGLPPPPRGEGDHFPGRFRQEEISIAHSAHQPPPPYDVSKYMEELFRFIYKPDPSKYDLLKTAIAHHRFLWIHPFANGNGRVVRMLTYAMLIKQGFREDIDRIINPNAVFCSDRKRYYDQLAKADRGNDMDILGWCIYVMQGLKDEINKIDRLANVSYLKTKILLPAIDYALKMKYISDLEATVLKIATEKQEVQAKDFKGVFKKKLPQEISRQLKRLKDAKMLVPIEKGGRKYVLKFQDNFLLRGVIQALDKEGFLPVSE